MRHKPTEISSQIIYLQNERKQDWTFSSTPSYPRISIRGMMVTCTGIAHSKQQLLLTEILLGNIYITAFRLEICIKSYNDIMMRSLLQNNFHINQAEEMRHQRCWVFAQVTSLKQQEKIKALVLFSYDIKVN